ncbi:MAG: hypothetical protein Q3M30_16605 [Candidatus Electrothrix sp. Rat3]|nr:hypothetical protein [Candidatus Electrothrix rattekaaiensis]
MNEIPKSVADHQQLLRTAFDAYLKQLNRGGLEPKESYFPYDFEEEINIRQWSFPFGIISEIVKGELRELTNDLNRWHESLKIWCAWNKVIQPYNIDEMKALYLRREFLESLVFYCLFQPASSRDRFTFVVTNAMHQVRLKTEDRYQDYLKGDPRTPDEVTKPKYLSRRKKENRLSNLISIWPEREEFMALLRAIDDEAYKNETSNYRNLHSHIIGPRLGLGHVQTVVRSVREHTTMKKQPNGTYIKTLTGKVVPSYGFGGTPPLDLEKAHAANLEQYRRARKCYESYRKLLATGMEAMPLAK